MKKKDTAVGMNKTGMDMSPIDSRQVIAGATVMPPSSEGDGSAIAELLTDYGSRDERVGTMPPPGTLKGAVKTAVQALKGNGPLILLDKLGERLAFERAGARLYEALIAKFDATGGFPGGPSREDLIEIRDEEAQHFLLVAMVMREQGADPTAETPSADVSGVAGSGLLKVVGDPRTSLAEALEAALIAELTDNDAWDLLIELCAPLNAPDTLAEFAHARAAEARHLKKVRAWVKAAVMESPTRRAPVGGNGGRGATPRA